MMKLKLSTTQHPKEGANLTNFMKMIKSLYLETIFSYQGVKREDTKQENFPTILVQILTIMVIINIGKERNHLQQVHLLNINNTSLKEIITLKKIVTLYNISSNS